MRFPPLLVGIAAALLAVSPVGGAPELSSGGITLAQCVARARTVSETLGISQETTKLVEAQYRDRLGDILPHVDWIKSQFYQQHIDSGSGGATGTNLLSTQPQSFFQITQALFGGFRDWAALDIASSLRQQARFNVAQAELQLLSDVATAFYSSLTAQEQITVLQEARGVTTDQIKQLGRWVNVGRSRPADLLSAQTEQATLDAEIEEAKRVEAEAREVLRLLTELPVEVPLIDDRPDPTLAPLTDALSRANGRPDLLSGQEALRQAQLGIKYAKGSYWPSLGFLGRYYTERVGFQSDIRWDATFTLDVPLLAGGSSRAQVQAARSQQLLAELTLHRSQRVAEQQVRTVYQNVAGLVSEAAAYQRAAELGQRDYDSQAREYRLGRTTNIELLQVLNNLQTIQSKAILSKYNSKLDYVLLRVATGDGL